MVGEEIEIDGGIFPDGLILMRDGTEYVELGQARERVAEERTACAAAVCRYCKAGVPTERDDRGRWYHRGRVQPGNLEMGFDCVAGAILERAGRQHREEGSLPT